MFKSLPIRASAATLLLSSLIWSGCSAPKMDCHTVDGKAAILDAVQNALTIQDCATAVELIEPVYQDETCTNDEVRKARASAYACAANINFFKLIGDLAEVELSGSGLWPAMTQLFPSVSSDQRVAAGHYALESLFALKKAGSIATASEMTDIGTPNVGYLLASHRDMDANIYSIFVSMSLIGAMQNRHGDPDPSSYKKNRNMGGTDTSDPGWGAVASVTEDACLYAASILTLKDSISEVSQSLTGSVGSSLVDVGAALTLGLDAACSWGCDGTALPTQSGVPATVTSGCSTTCSQCPTQLRDWKACRALVQDAALDRTTNDILCAVAGVANFINHLPGGWENQ